MPRKPLGLIELFLLVLFSYPLFYYAYKFGTPDLGGSDFYSYYGIYESWDFTGVESPFNIRLVSCSLVFLLHKTGLFYNTTISFQNPEISQQVFFSALLFNYLCTLLTAWWVFRIIWRFCDNRAYALLFAFSYLLGFGTLFYSLNALTDACSYLLFALILDAYWRRSWWVLPLIAIAVFQREIIFAYIGLIAAFDFCLTQGPRKFFAGTFTAAGLGMASYIALRKTLFLTPKYTEQMDVGSYLDRLLNTPLNWPEYIRQVFLNQNILLFYLAVLAYKLTKHLTINKLNASLVAALYLQGVIISFIGLFGNNLGRFVTLLSPMFLLFAALELTPLLMHRFGFPGKPRPNSD
jgi:hypothetical protein